MKLTGKVLIRDIYNGKSSGYLTAVDLETGGDLKLTVPGVIDKSLLMKTVDIDASVVPTNYPIRDNGNGSFYGGFSLVVNGGQCKMTPIKG